MITIKNRSVLGVVASCLILGAGTSAMAGLVGLNVNSTYYIPDLSTPSENDGTQLINPTASFSAFGSIGEFVTDSQIIISNPGNLDETFFNSVFNGPVFDFLNSGTLIQSVTIDGATNVSPIVTVTSDGAGGQLVEVNLSAQPFRPGFDVTLDVHTSSVPEPSGFVLLSAGLASIGVFCWMNRRKSKVVAA
jgi:hypothetical protein